MNELDFLADRILNSNFLTKEELIKMIEDNFNQRVYQMVLDKLSKWQLRKIELIDKKSNLLDENCKIDEKLNDIKSLKGTENEVSSKRYYGMKTAKRAIGRELTQIQNELSKLNLMISAAEKTTQHGQ